MYPPHLICSTLAACLCSPQVQTRIVAWKHTKHDQPEEIKNKKKAFQEKAQQRKNKSNLNTESYFRYCMWVKQKSFGDFLPNTTKTQGPAAYAHTQMQM